MYLETPPPVSFGVKRHTGLLKKAIHQLRRVGHSFPSKIRWEENGHFLQARCSTCGEEARIDMRTGAFCGRSFTTACRTR